MSVEQEENRRRRGIYLLPNLFTTASLFAGFYAIIAAMKGQFEAAAVAIFIAMIMDTLDGRVARLTNTQSSFGMHYDSLSDLVSFGVAPALITYQWALSGLGKVGWLAAFIFAAATALRLARFNSMVNKVEKKYFQGLACPSAAGVIAGMIWIGVRYQIDGHAIEYLVWIITVMMGLLMVSNFRYYSFKGIDLKGKVPFVAVLFVVLVFVAISVDPPNVLFAVFFLYSISGPIWTLMVMRKQRRNKLAMRAKKEMPQDNQESVDDKQHD